jgi:hypothetical protein
MIAGRRGRETGVVSKPPFHCKIDVVSMKDELKTRLLQEENLESLFNVLIQNGRLI